MTAVTDPQAALFAALAKAQGEFEPVTRDRDVEVKMKAGGTYKFSYATLAGAIEITRPVLAANGLAVTQFLASTDDGRPAITTSIHHEAGGLLTGTIPIKTDGLDPQGVGSLVTYTRRYAYFGALGLAPVDDDDANHASGNQARSRTRANGNGAAKKAPAVLVQEIEQVIARLNETGTLGEVDVRDGMLSQYGTRETAALTIEQAKNLRDRLMAKAADGVPA